jgi:hypothetical protein
MDGLNIGDRVEIRLDSKFGEAEGWYGGTIFRIEPYSAHRSFYWVRLDEHARAVLKVGEISVFNPKNIRKANQNQPPASPVV